jgi:CheY-like chemotaxis protein
MSQKYDEKGKFPNIAVSGQIVVEVHQFPNIAGYDVLEATDGLAAIEISRAHPGPIHVLVTDVIMPGSHGGEVADVIEQARPEIKTILMSGYMRNADRLQHVLTPSRSFLAKPFAQSVLLQHVEGVLGGS